jgi:hypothetical protein
MRNFTAAERRRFDKLTEAWVVLLNERETARRFNNAAMIAGYETALRLLDACMWAEEYGDQDDQDLVDRLREIARARDVLREAPKDETETTPGGEA